MKTALFAGTFDPPTLGHLDIIERAAALCDKLYVAVAENSDKHLGLFSVEERLQMLEGMARNVSNVEVISFSGLVADFVQENGIDCLIRGLRAFSDFEYEFRMALANRKMANVETLFLVANEKVAHISSTLIREIARSGKHLEEFVPKGLIPMIYARVRAQVTT